MGEKVLIINADDAGLSRGITEGIALGHSKGVVTSTSLMVNLPNSEYALQQLRQFPMLGIGVHLNICRGTPILPRPKIATMVDGDGNFWSYAVMKRKLWNGQIAQRELEAEFCAQIRWMKERGVHPTHADSHDHLHLCPFAIRAFRHALLAEGVFRARAARHRYWPRNPLVVSGAFRGTVYRRVAITAYTALLQQTAFRDLLLPRAILTAHPKYRRDLRQLGHGWGMAIRNLPPGIFELPCHPGFSESGFSEQDKLRERRELELQILTNASFRTLIQQNGIRLSTYSELQTMPGFLGRMAPKCSRL